MANALDEHYARIEAGTTAFSRESGVACPSGCGECCTAIDFLVSRPEAEQVAAFLLDHPAALERFLAQPIADPDAGKHGQGRMGAAMTSGAHGAWTRSHAPSGDGDKPTSDVLCSHPRRSTNMDEERKVPPRIFRVTFTTA